MMISMRRAILSILACFVLAGLPTSASARAPEVEREIVDARLEGFGEVDGKPLVVSLEPGSTALSWFLLSFLAVLSLSVMFKHAKRTHLD